jgi:NADPH:quinone reductase-like Zn-dependent oxidoreductase
MASSLQQAGWSTQCSVPVALPERDGRKANSMAVRGSRKHRAPAIPKKMKAAAIDRFGPPSVLKARELPVPRPGPREVLIALDAAGVGVWDAAVRDGSWRPGGERPEFPLVLGTDGAGIVEAKGARVRRFRIGDRVYGYAYASPRSGFYAEYVAVDSRYVGRVPRRLDPLQAGAAAATGLTALQGIDDTLRVRRGQTILIFGATGAVGTLAVQFAKRRGARVLATASGRKAAALVRRLGADGVIDARDARAQERLEALAPEGIDAVLALAGGKALERCLDLVGKGGQVAYPNGIEPEPRRRKGIRRLAYDAESGPRELARLGRAVTAARLRVPIAATYPLAQAARAHRRMGRGRVLGRIVLRIRRGRA